MRFEGLIFALATLRNRSQLTIFCWFFFQITWIYCKRTIPNQSLVIPTIQNEKKLYIFNVSSIILRILMGESPIHNIAHINHNDTREIKRVKSIMHTNAYNAYLLFVASFLFLSRCIELLFYCSFCVLLSPLFFSSLSRSSITHRTTETQNACVAWFFFFWIQCLFLVSLKTVITNKGNMRVRLMVEASSW